MKFIITLALFLGMGALIVLGVLFRERPKWKKNAFLGAAVCLVLFIGVNSFTVIPTGFSGVRTTMGQIDNVAIPNGFNLKLPFIQTIQVVNNKQQDINFRDRVWSESAVRTAVYAENIVVTYSVDSARSAWVFANVSNYNNLMSLDLVASTVKARTKQFSDTDVTNRALIEPAVEAALQEAVDAKYDVGVVHIHKVTISNIDFDESYNAAIAEKQRAQLNYETQQIDNKKNIEKAQADADAKLIYADANAKANDMMQISLTPEILQKMWIEKWDGNLPSTVAGDDSNLMIGLPVPQQSTPAE